ncbi:MAG TPA: hypothetical protein VK453_12970 [Micromonosporaceae bacterium]|nr:hypothetical protein [Micromonosporaceae bacterium]
MQRREKLPPEVGYPAMVLFAGFIGSVVVTVAIEGRASDFNPWVVGFGGTFLFFITAAYTVLNALDSWRAWQLRLFGVNTWAVLIDTQARSHGDDMVVWTATVQGADFTNVIENGFHDPGKLGDRVPVRRHAASN